MDPARRRRILAWARIWPLLILVVVVLNSTLTTTGDPRWSSQLRPYYPDGLGAFLAWTLPALGIVWSFARLWAVPKGEPIGRRRAFWTMVRSGFGMTFVLILIGAYVHAFHVNDVGSLHGFATWCALGLLMLLTLTTIRGARRFGFTPPERIGGAIGTAAVLAVGAWHGGATLPPTTVSGFTAARELRATVLTPATPPAADLVSFGERVTNLAVNNQWLRRPDGCDVMGTAEEARLSNIGDSIRKAGAPRSSGS